MQCIKAINSFQDGKKDLICITSRLLFRHLLKRVRVGDVIDEDGSVGVAVVDGPEGVEPLLARRVPYREVAPRPADVDLLVQEGRLKGGSKVKET